MACEHITDNFVDCQSKGPSGSAAKKKIKWAFFDSMNFLDADNPEPNACVGNIESMIDETAPGSSTTP